MERVENLAKIVAAVHAEMEPHFGSGSVADYIHALARVQLASFQRMAARDFGDYRLRRHRIYRIIR
ncbi:MAG: hypothetical protein ACLPTZ_25765, partial [Beijerinckiaceae bacterium]